MNKRTEAETQIWLLWYVIGVAWIFGVFITVWELVVKSGSGWEGLTINAQNQHPYIAFLIYSVALLLIALRARRILRCRGSEQEADA